MKEIKSKNILMILLWALTIISLISLLSFITMVVFAVIKNKFPIESTAYWFVLFWGIPQSLAYFNEFFIPFAFIGVIIISPICLMILYKNIGDIESKKQRKKEKLTAQIQKQQEELKKLNDEDNLE